MLRNRRVHGEECHFVGGQHTLSVVRSQSSVVKDALRNAYLATDNGPLTTDELSELFRVSSCLYACHTALSHRFGELPRQAANVPGGEQAFNVGPLPFIGSDKLR